MANGKLKAALKEHMMKGPKAAHPSIPKFKKGGPTTDDRMKYGKQMSRALNQKTG